MRQQFNKVGTLFLSWEEFNVYCCFFCLLETTLINTRFANPLMFLLLQKKGELAAVLANDHAELCC